MYPSQSSPHVTSIEPILLSTTAVVRIAKLPKLFDVVTRASLVSPFINEYKKNMIEKVSGKLL